LCKLHNALSLIKACVLTYRYSGEMVELGSQLDELANFLWENVSDIDLAANELSD